MWQGLPSWARGLIKLVLAIVALLLVLPLLLRLIGAAFSRVVPAPLRAGGGRSAEAQETRAESQAVVREARAEAREARTARRDLRALIRAAKKERRACRRATRGTRRRGGARRRAKAECNTQYANTIAQLRAEMTAGDLAEANTDD